MAGGIVGFAFYSPVREAKRKDKMRKYDFLIKKLLKFTLNRLIIGAYSMNERNGRTICREGMIERMPREEYYLYA